MRKRTKPYSLLNMAFIFILSNCYFKTSLYIYLLTMNQLFSSTGLKHIIVTDTEKEVDFNVLVQYPTLSEPHIEHIGPYDFQGLKDTSIAEGMFPLILISHGNSGSHLIYRSITTELAKNGCIVAMIEHYGNNRNDNHLGESLENLVLRPKHCSLTIDSLLSSDFKDSIDNDKIGIIGHSFGGYTALALAGGKPFTKEGDMVDVKKDKRIKTIVLMAPAAAFFMRPHSLCEVDIPIQVFIAEKDEFIPPVFSADTILSKEIHNREKLDIHIIENAGHFAFITPFPEHMNSPQFLPSTDPSGFNRSEFHQSLPHTIKEFLFSHLYEL
jgi:predicted dienelactone hydrolase